MGCPEYPTMPAGGGPRCHRNGVTLYHCDGASSGVTTTRTGVRGRKTVAWPLSERNPGRKCGSVCLASPIGTRYAFSFPALGNGIQ